MKKNSKFRLLIKKCEESKLWKNILHYSGLGYIWWMIERPLENNHKRQPSNFIIWIVGIHFAILGFAYQRYESRVTRRENAYNSLIEQLDERNINVILQLIIDDRTRKVPTEPKLWPPTTVYKSLNSENDIVHFETDDLALSTIRTYLKSLERVTLSRLIFEENLALYNRTFVADSGTFGHIQRGPYVREPSTENIPEILRFEKCKVRSLSYDLDFTNHLYVNNSQIDTVHLEIRNGLLSVDTARFGLINIQNSSIHINFFRNIKADSAKITNNLFYDPRTDFIDDFSLLKKHNIFFQGRIMDTSLVAELEKNNSILINCRIPNNSSYTTKGVDVEIDDFNFQTSPWHFYRITKEDSTIQVYINWSM